MASPLNRLIENQRAREGKALPAHPALMSDDPTTIYSPGASRQRATLSQREAGRHLEAFGGKDAIDYVMDCVMLYAENASSAAWHFEKGHKRVALDGDDEAAEIKTPVDPLLKTLMEQPNEHMDYAELIEHMVIDLLLVGNAYWLKWRTYDKGKPLALYRLAPQYVKIEPGDWGPAQYTYQIPGQRNKLELSPDEVVHFRRPNPHDGYYGMGVIRGGGRAFDLELALTDSQASYFENKADPSLIVQSERRVPRDVFNKLRAQLRARVAGPRRTGDLLVLEAGLKATSLTPNARDAMYAQLGQASRDRIYAKFHCSPRLFGIEDEASGSDKVTDVRREFDNYTMRPFLTKLQKRITKGVVKPWELDFVIDYRYVLPQEDQVKLGGDFASLPGVKVKEVRQFALVPLGFDASTGDPEIDDLVLNVPGEELGPDGEPLGGGPGFPDRSLPREPGRPPDGENTEVFGAGGKVPAGAKVRKPQRKAVPDPESWAERMARAEMKAVTFEPQRPATTGRVAGEQRPADTIAGQREGDVDAIVASMRPGILDALHELERGLLDNVEGKAFEPDTLKRRVRNSNAWKTFASMLGRTLEEGAVRAISTAAVHQGTAGLEPDEPLDYDEIARGIVHRSDGVTQITKNLRDEIVQKVGQALREDKSRGEVEQIVRESIDFWRESKAETVALTEATHAYNEGTLSMAEAAGIGEVYVVDGEDHDDACKDANGQVWEIAHARDHRLEHPRCRRAFLPLTSQAVA